MAATFKKIGLVGGVGWPSTVMYYEGLCRAAQPVLPGGSPRLTIESLDMAQTMARRGTANDAPSWEGFDRIFREALVSLAAAGCTVAAIASVTPHARFDAITSGLSLPVVSILGATTRVARDHGIPSAIVLATPMTMAATWFHDGLRADGIDCPDVVTAHDRAEIADLLEAHFYAGRGIEGRAALLRICHRLSALRPDAAIVLACTDFPAAFPEHASAAVFEVEGLTFLDAAAAHVQAILAAALMPG